MKLQQAIQNLKNWQAEHHGNNPGGACLGTTRLALSEAGLKLPSPMPNPHNLALDNFRALVADPGKYGWTQIHAPLNQPCLVYFGDCGKLSDGRVAGHIGILSDGVIYSDVDYKWDAYWASKIVGAFIPAE
jgi:hypothetical protein